MARIKINRSNSNGAAPRARRRAGLTNCRFARKSKGENIKVKKDPNLVGHEDDHQTKDQVHEELVTEETVVEVFQEQTEIHISIDDDAVVVEVFQEQKEIHISIGVNDDDDAVP